jgi:hypothetical protein
VNWAILAASIGLVIATAGLVYFTKRLADEATLTRAEMFAAREEAVRTREEMTKARSLSVRPKLAFDLMVLGGRVGLLLIRNVGNGVALRVALDISFDSGDSSDIRHWSEPSIVPGESHELKLPEFALRNVGTLSEKELRIRVGGSMRDVDDDEIRVEEDLHASEWWRNVVAAQERAGGRRKLPGIDPTEWGIAKTGHASTD